MDRRAHRRQSNHHRPSIKPQNIVVDVIPIKTHRLSIPSPSGTIRSQPSASIAAPHKPVTIKTQVIRVVPLFGDRIGQLSLGLRRASAIYAGLYRSQLYLAAATLTKVGLRSISIGSPRRRSRTWRRSVPPSSPKPTKTTEQKNHHHDDQECIRIHGRPLHNFRRRRARIRMWTATGGEIAAVARSHQDRKIPYPRETRSHHASDARE